MKKTAQALAMLTTLAALGATAAPAAAHGWAAHHPRQAQVIGRAHHQIARINDQRRDGEITGQEARTLRAEDRAIVHETRSLAKANGGYITRDQQRALNAQLNAHSRVIGH